MPKLPVTDFSLGFISAYDIDPLKLKSGSFSDALNMEINLPILGVASSLGYGSSLSSPSYTGDRNVAFTRFSVDYPSDNEIVVLIKACNNLIKYSEDFEMSSVWTWTAGTGGSPALNPNADNAPLRKGDEVVSASGGDTKLAQNFTVTSLDTITFSVYIKMAQGLTAVLAIVDSSGETTEVITGNGAYTRGTVARVLQSSTGTKVEIRFVEASTNYKIWGAKVERNNGATAYGPTYDKINPYYILMFPYYAGGAWVNSWIDLTDYRAGKIDSVSSGVSFTLKGTLDGGADAYKNWRAGNLITFSSSGSTFTTNNTSGLSAGDEIAIRRFPGATDTPYYNVDSGVVERNISFLDAASELRISFGKTHRPLILKYSNFTDGFNGSGKTIAYDGFYLDYATHSAQDPYAFYENLNASITTINVTDDAGVTLEANTEYRVTLVGLIDGKQRVLITSATATTSTGTTRKLAVDIAFDHNYLTPRLTAIEVYIGKSSEGEEAAYYHGSIPINGAPPAQFSGWTWYTNKMTGTYGIISLDSSSNTMLINMGRLSTIETRARFDIQVFLRERIFIAQTADNSDYLRFSLLRGITGEYDNFAYSDADGYGYIVAEAGTSEKIMGISPTLDNDMLILKDKSVLVYEVQSGQALAKKLVNLYNGIGCISSRSLVLSSFGNFWADSNGIYQYVGGGNRPMEISEAKISNWIRNVLASYLPYSFAIFNKKLNEYWLFTQVSGTVGSTDAADYRVIRYSVKNSNFNLMRFDFVPIWAGSRTNGEVEILGTSNDIRKWGYTSFPLPVGYIKGNPNPLGDVTTDKMILTLESKYSSNGNFRAGVYVNDETSIRTGNSIVFLSSRKFMDRQLRQSTRAKTISLYISQVTAGTTLGISSVSVGFVNAVERYSG